MRSVGFEHEHKTAKSMTKPNVPENMPKSIKLSNSLYRHTKNMINYAAMLRYDTI